MYSFRKSVSGSTKKRDSGQDTVRILAWIPPRRWGSTFRLNLINFQHLISIMVYYLDGDFACRWQIKGTTLCCV